MEAILFSKMSVHTRAIHHHIQEDGIIQKYVLVQPGIEPTLMIILVCGKLG
jgi:hypothetical protein